MRKKILLFSAFFAMAMAGMAQKDITPARYVFANQKVGTFTYDEALAGANPANAYDKAVDNFHDGYIVINNGQFGAGLDAAPNAMYIQSGTSIVDMGGEVGKVLCIKGANSTFPFGKAAEGTFGIGWWNMSFYTPSNVPEETPVRFRIVFKIVENTPDILAGMLAVRAYTYAGDFSDATKAYGSSEFIARYDDDDSPKEDENGNYYYEDNLWQAVEFDYQAGTEAGIPMRLALAFSNQAKLPNSTILIKEIKMTMSPVGEPKAEEAIRFSSSVANEKIKFENKVSYAVSGNRVELRGLNAGEKVYVYMVNGKMVKTFTAKGSNDYVTLSDGLYFVKSATSTLKVSVK